MLERLPPARPPLRFTDALPFIYCCAPRQVAQHGACQERLFLGEAKGVAWTDADLVKRTLAGDREAFGALVERHRRALFIWALQHGLRPEEAEDAAQETFLKAYRNLRRLQEHRAFAGWLYGIAGHVLGDAARRRARRREHAGLEEAPEPAAPADERSGAAFDEDSN